MKKPWKNFNRSTKRSPEEATAQPEAKVDPKVASVAEALRQCYYSYRALHQHALGLLESDDPGQAGVVMWDGGTTSRGTTYKSIWPGLAKTAIEQNFQADVWVAALFSLSHTFDIQPPPPTFLTSKAVTSRIRNMRSELELDAFYSTQSEFQQALREQWQRQKSMAPASASRSLILDTKLELSILVRYVVAVKYAHNDLQQILQAGACQQYSANPAMYKNVLIDWLPANMDSLVRTQGVEP